MPWAISKCRLFLASLPQFIVISDHHPLIPILTPTTLMRSRTCDCSISKQESWAAISRINGALNNAPDALSCQHHPITNPLPRHLHAECDIDEELGISIAEIRAVSGAHEYVRLDGMQIRIDAIGNFAIISWMT